MAQIMLSVIAVNYNSSSLLRECFLSIHSALGSTKYEFLAVDSGSHETDVHNLLVLKEQGAEILLNKENIGYAKAVNQGLSRAKGDFILITNPDVLYRPDSIQRMMQSISELPRCGAVGPKTWWNRQMTFLLPVSELVVPYRIFMTELARVSQTVNRVIFKRWIKKTLGYWLSEDPVEQEMLSGASIMTTRKVLEKVGGFDDSFPLYFEDTDWSLRVRKAGYCLFMVPQAHIVHYYNQSAKQDPDASSRKYHDSSEKYLSKHFGKGQLSLFRLLMKYMKTGALLHSAYEEKGILTAPPAFIFKNDAKKLFLLSPVDLMIPSAGSFFEGNSFTIPEDLWALLGEGRYYAKAVDLTHFHECGSWQWMKKA